METQPIVLDREKARELWRKYREHRHWSQPIDQEIMRTYDAIAKGRMVIKALESIRVAGVNADGMPKLAIAHATAKECWLRVQSNGTCIMADNEPALWRTNSRQRFTFRPGELTGLNTRQWRSTAIVPIVPLDLRPKRGLANYHVLWEAEWSARVPVDPMLLRRIGQGDLWIVVAAWDLTEIERAALAARVHG